MKKLIAVLLTLCMVLCLCPLTAWAEEFDVTDEAAVAELSHKVYEANRYDAIFSRHQSVSFVSYYVETPEMNEGVWETADCLYRQTNTGYARFDRDRVYYEMERDEETGSIALRAGVDFSADYDPKFSLTNGPEEMFYDAEHDHYTDIHTENGYLYMHSRYDEVLSREFFEDVLGQEYAGQIVTSETIADPETYEVEMFINSVEEDDGEREVYIISVEYDSNEPVSCLNLRASFEREALKTADVTYVVDPGTEHEIVRTLTVPAYSEIDSKAGDETYVCFSDPDCETLSLWDGEEDATYYFFTNPGDELLEKYNALLDALEREQYREHSAEIMQDLIEANLTETVLENHDSIYVTWSNTTAGDSSCYIDANCRTDAFPDYNTLILGREVWYDSDPSEETQAPAYQFFAMSEEECEELWTRYSSTTVNAEYSALEEIQDVKDNGDGTLTITTILGAEDFESLIDEYPQEIPEEYRGFPSQTVYILDAETMELLSVVGSVIRDGEVIPYDTETVVYDVPAPESLAGLTALYDKYSVVDPEDAWTFHVIYDAGTEAEESFSVQLNKAVSVLPYLRSGYYAASYEQGENELTCYAEPVQA